MLFGLLLLGGLLRLVLLALRLWRWLWPRLLTLWLLSVGPAALRAVPDDRQRSAAEEAPAGEGDSAVAGERGPVPEPHPEDVLGAAPGESTPGLLLLLLELWLRLLLVLRLRLLLSALLLAAAAALALVLRPREGQSDLLCLGRMAPRATRRRGARFRGGAPRAGASRLVSRLGLLLLLPWGALRLVSRLGLLLLLPWGALRLRWLSVLLGARGLWWWWWCRWAVLTAAGHRVRDPSETLLVAAGA